MEELRAKLNAYWKASEELQNSAIVASVNKKSRLSLAESRLMREKALDAQVKGARAEKYIADIKIKNTQKMARKR